MEKLEAQILGAQGSVQASEKREAPEPDAGVTRRPSSKTETPIRVVDQMHRGDHVTITEAIEAANPGDRILVRPGLYHEGLVIEKPLEIIGDGEPGEVVVEARGEYALLFKTTIGRVANLTLRQMESFCIGPPHIWLPISASERQKIDFGRFGVDIAQGRLELEECDITSQGIACVIIRDGADPRLRHNRIRDGSAIGVYVCNNGQGVLEDNDIFGNGDAGVVIDRWGNPTLRRNRINKNGYWAVSVTNGGGGTIEDNDLRGNAEGAWNVSSDSEPNLIRARNQE